MHCKVLEKLETVVGVLVTAGGAGCSYAFKGSGGKSDYSGNVPVLKVTPEDTTGAGDAFLAGFLASLVKVRPTLQVLLEVAEQTDQTVHLSKLHELASLITAIAMHLLDMHCRVNSESMHEQHLSVAVWRFGCSARGCRQASEVCRVCSSLWGFHDYKTRCNWRTAHSGRG